MAEERSERPAEEWTAVSMPDVDERQGFSVCDECGDVDSGIWGMQWPGDTAVSQRCVDCVAKRLAMALSLTPYHVMQPRELEWIFETFDTVKFKRAPDGKTSLEIGRMSDKARDRLMAMARDDD